MILLFDKDTPKHVYKLFTANIRATQIQYNCTYNTTVSSIPYFPNRKCKTAAIEASALCNFVEHNNSVCYLYTVIFLSCLF